MVLKRVRDVSMYKMATAGLAVAILYILTSRTRFRSWSFYRYRKRFGDLDHCFPGPSVKTDDRWNRENKELVKILH
jgi:hypothetical protein